MKFVMGYMTTPTKTEAKRIVDVLLSKKLIACANILPAGESIYVWQGKKQIKKEVTVVFKTRTSHTKEITKVVEKAHSYECPCIIFWPFAHGSKKFLEWIEFSC